MKRHLLLAATMAATLAGCAEQEEAPTLAAPRPLQETTIQLYRGVRVMAGTSQVDWSKVSFGVSGNPATLSLFNAMNPDLDVPCWIRITVTAPDAVQPGGQATLNAPNPAVGGANPGPWPVVFDNNPAGHWSIAKATIGGESNNKSSEFAAAAFAAMKAANMVSIMDGTATGCQ